MYDENKDKQVREIFQSIDDSSKLFKAFDDLEVFDGEAGYYALFVKFNQEWIDKLHDYYLLATLEHKEIIFSIEEWYQENWRFISPQSSESLKEAMSKFSNFCEQIED